MNPFPTFLSTLCSFSVCCLSAVAASTGPAPQPSPFSAQISTAETTDKAFAAYFRKETFKIQENFLKQNASLEQVERHKQERLSQLQEMFGLDPMPPKTDLKATTTGTLDQPEFTVEKIHFQSMPGLYVTGNLYVPKNLKAPAPAILYLCGHARMIANGVSCGNKTGYQHWGAWFARNGYVCLMIDTVQLGEIEGIHHGTHQKDAWWWNSRGYSSAAAEAWNSIRALDYLETRPEVDKTRFGVSGRSGGGAYSWALAALDERIKVACPTAGITDMQNHVVDGCISGHCDCMFMVNTYRWDYSQLAALLAPRPLLICNTDRDPIFPLEGVNRIHSQVREVYALYKATENLGLLITAGPHKDSQELQVPVMRWFNKWLKKDEAPLSNFAETVFRPEQLRVFTELPGDEITSKCQETFTKLADPHQPLDPVKTLAALQTKTFGAWPAAPGALQLQRLTEASPATGNNASAEIWQFNSAPEIPLKLQLVPAQGTTKDASIRLWIGESSGELPSLPEQKGAGTAYAVFYPTGAGEGTLAGDKKQQTHFRRRFMQLGGTLAGMQVWEVRRAIQAVRAVPGMQNARIELNASQGMTEVACFAALFEPNVSSVNLASAPRNDKEAPDFLNWSRLVTPPQLLELTKLKTSVNVRSEKLP